MESLIQSPDPAPIAALRGEVRRLERLVDNAQSELIRAIENEKNAHKMVEAWRVEVNRCVEKRQEFEKAVAALEKNS